MHSTTPDIAKRTKSAIPATLDKVGMEDIEVPLLFSLGGEAFKQMGKADAFVNLIKKEAKGIHMSRLFIKLHEEFGQKPFSKALAKSVLEGFLESHVGLSDTAFLKLSFDQAVPQKSLTSEQTSLRSYPVTHDFSMGIGGGFHWKLTFSVLYSSTCPCSAALSRRALQEKFKESFDPESSQLNFEELHQWLGQEENMAATPHSQRSKATFTFDLDEDFALDLSDLVALTHETLKTSVQSIVKREDEKEFAKLNANNLMFAEDAARRLKKAVESIKHVKSSQIKVCHYESLHAHNAVAYSST